MKNDQKNFILFAVIAALVLFAWQPIVDRFFPSNPRPTTVESGAEMEPKANPKADPTAEAPAVVRDRAKVIAETPRVRIDTPHLKGSINLKGARIDDLVLPEYRQTIAEDSPPIRLLSPAGTPHAYFAGFGWRAQGIVPPGPDTVWQADSKILTPGRPVTLTAQNGRGQRFAITIGVDDQYMFTVKQTVANAGNAPVQVRPYALVNRSGESEDADTWTIHTGPMAVHGGAADYDIDFDDLDEKPAAFDTTGGWMGFTDKYWLTALVPDQSRPVSAQFRSGANQTYQSDYTPTQPRLLQPGQQTSYTSRFFAGGKEVSLLQHYQSAGVPLFDKAIDWGWFEIVEKPIFYYLDWLFRHVGNFGIAIILLTLTIRGAMFPIAQRQFRSMAGMRAIQPKMKALQERHKDDKPRLQQEMMQLYKEEKVNPLGGCAPTLLQIPVFFALYKVLQLTIEMRHKPFVLWIKDLSAPDPLTPVNLFGLLDFTPPHFIAIGVIPILLGISMFFQFRLNPAPMDDTQKQIFGLMPWVLMFVMAPFAVGLQIYWITSNLVTIAQQQYLYSRHPQLKQQKEKAKAE
ncbi:membrane protein insertase YidC [Stakelama saccharophila]|uniref:Membrane protein insertase YidC n=1 Tax=Stakelama saccharophila TaxID=3075605 RepID=A0ABZ0B4K9_9SPHN|nr:membrane protein insertase YidC [Stakelama sp. W311]WNO52333.1 membrane protein insertase YidC [Stakelama sp. W311]